MRRLALVLLVAIAGSGCSSSLAPTATETDPEIREMKVRILELQRKATMAEVELDRLRQEVAALEASLRGGGASVEPPRVSAARPRADIERREPTVTGAMEVSDLELPAVKRAPDSSITPVEGMADLAPSTSVNAAAQALYDRGYTLYHQGRYMDAETSFQRFVQSYPATALADNALYWIGEARFARGDIQGALAAFEETLRKYPEGNKVADALVKSAGCLERLGDGEGAMARYDEVVRRFPDSAAAAMAGERRSRLP